MDDDPKQQLLKRTNREVGGHGFQNQLSVPRPKEVPYFGEGTKLPSRRSYLCSPINVGRIAPHLENIDRHARG